MTGMALLIVAVLLLAGGLVAFLPAGKLLMALMKSMMIPPRVDPIPLKEGEIILAVTLETRWKRVYKETLLISLKTIPIGFLIGSPFVLIYIILQFVGNLRQIATGQVGFPILEATAIVALFAWLVTWPTMVYKYAFEEVNRRYGKIILTNRQVIVWNARPPFRNVYRSDTPLDRIADVVALPVGYSPKKPLDWFGELWAGIALEKARAQCLILPSMMHVAMASDTFDIDYAFGFVKVLAAVVGEFKKFDKEKSVVYEQAARARLADTLKDQGIPVGAAMSQLSYDDIAEAAQIILNPSGILARDVDPLTLEDPSICDFRTGKIDPTAMGASVPGAAPSTAPTGNPFKGFQTAPMPGQVVNP